MEGKLTAEQREALKDGGARAALRYVVDMESLSEPARYEGVMRDLGIRLGVDNLKKYFPTLIETGLVHATRAIHVKDVPLADGRGTIVFRNMTEIYTLGKELPDGARWEIGRLLYTV